MNAKNAAFLRICRNIGWALFVFGAGAINAQTLVVKDRSSLQRIEGAVVACEPTGAYAITNAKGVVPLDALRDATSITVSHLGYQTITIRVDAIADGVIHMVQRVRDLNEVVVSASRFEEPKRDVPEHIDIIDRRAITLLDQQTTPDVLQNSGALFVQRSQMGGGSPVIRGFEASRVLLVVDGVRMNNAIYRTGHLQDLMAIDPNALDRIEVISGPGSVVYGSDALGGVIHLLTRTPRFSDSIGFMVNGGAMLRTSTANNELSANATVELRGPKVTSLTSITASDFGDLRSGSNRDPEYQEWGLMPFLLGTTNGTDTVLPNDDPDLQQPTGYRQLDILQKLRLRTGTHMVHQLNA